MKTKTKNLLSISAILLLLFGILTFFVQKNVLVGFDLSTTVRLQRIIPDFLILPFSVFSLLGTVEIASVVLLILLFKLKKLDKLVFLFLFGLTGVFELLGKLFISQIGPPIQFLKTTKFFEVPSDYIPHDFFSYPSGHAMRTSFISAVLLLIIWQSKKLNKNQKIILCLIVGIFDLLMFISRIYLGEHWTSDVLGGLILGFGLFFLGAYFSRRFSAR